MLPLVNDLTMWPAARHRAALLGQARGRVLDVGIGTGLNLRCYSGIDSLVGLDRSAGMLRVCRRRARAMPWPVELIRERAEQLPFAAGEFDTVVATFVLCSVADPVAAAAEMRRVLRPGGAVLFLEHERDPDERIARWQRAVRRPWGVLFGGCDPTRDPLAALTGAGLAIRQTRHFAGRWFPVVRRHVAGIAVAEAPPIGPAERPRPSLRPSR